ncbi:MAG: hypothetical protein HYR96_12435 [Deltaproteobacteria bacterium]|nr:hypothetical protein [Deltaproteobacteria bacterium]MBI3296141.1 hypothetical protein [Deltaproteobacteria bacterium]
MRIITVLLSFYSLAAIADVAFMREVEGSKQIWVAGDDGHNPKAVTTGADWHLYPSFDSSGERIVFVRGDKDNTEIVVKTLATGDERVVAPRGGLKLHPHFSGDGKWVAYSAPQADGRPQIEVKNLVEESTPRVLKEEGACYFPRLSSDGAFVVFQRDRSKDVREIVILDLESNKETVVPSKAVKNMAPAISFDDRLIAFTAFDGKRWDVWAWDRLSGASRRVTEMGTYNFAPTFQRDGAIVFASDRSGHFALYRVNQAIWKMHPSDGENFLAMPGDVYAPSFSGRKEIGLEKLPDIPLPGRSSFGAIRHGEQIYVIGGHQGPEHTYSETSFLDRADILDTRLMTWRTGAPRLSKSHGFTLATYGKFIYAFGGFAYALPEQKFAPRWRSLDVIERYDTVANRWELIGHMPRKRSSYVVGVVDDKAYLIGGWDSTPRFEGDLDGAFHRKIDVFDFETETISEAPFELPDPLRRALSAVVYKGEIFLVGGLGQGGSHFALIDRVTSLNPLTGEFRERARLPFATFAPAAGIVGDSLFVFGGMFKTSEKEYVYVNHLFEMEIPIDLWTHTGRHMRDAKGFAQVVDWEKSLVVLGGHSYAGGNDAPVPTVDRFFLK